MENEKRAVPLTKEQAEMLIKVLDVAPIKGIHSAKALLEVATILSNHEGYPPMSQMSPPEAQEE